MTNFGKRFCQACKNVAATTALGACVICGASTGAPAATSAAPHVPVEHIKVIETPEVSLSHLFRDYREQRDDYHYDGNFELKNVEATPVMGTATLPHPPWPFGDLPWEPPTLDLSFGP